MYKLLLILKYLRKRRIAWVSLIAVTLCTAMVLVVISVMGGWLRMFRLQFHGLSGDITVRGQPLLGFSYYDQMVERIQKIDGVGAAVPVIRTFGLININNQKPAAVQVVGYQIDRIGLVNNFPQTLYRQYQQYLDKANDKSNGLTDPQRDALRKQAEQSAEHPSFDLPFSPETYRDDLPTARSDVAKWPGMIAGSGVVEVRRDSDGKMIRPSFLYHLPVKLTVLGVPPGGGLELDPNQKSETNYWIIDDSHTKVWQTDENTVYVPFAVLQRDLNMDEQHLKRRDGTPVTLPACCTEIDVKVKDGFNLDAVSAQVKTAIDDVQRDMHAVVYDPPTTETWEEVNGKYLNAIENEKLLMTILFGIISVVAIFLIFCIFYMIVAEKTRDIGIIKSVGASSAGIGAIFLGYGLAIGLVGSGLGFLAGWGIVHNINFLHGKLASIAHVKIWDPAVYQFDTIPNTVNPPEVAVILIVAIFSSVLGALVPAIRAARMNPVDAVRWE